MVQTKRYAGLTAANTKKVAMAAPMFSIIIPTLNVAAVLPACLDSIARQTCGDFELVLVDGGSTDETLDIANIFAPNLGERLIIHRDTDQGVYDAMNRGVDLATGTWLLFLGADDSLYEADTLARVAAFIGEHEPSDLVYGDVIMRSTNSAGVAPSTSTVCCSSATSAIRRSSTAADSSAPSVPTTSATGSWPTGTSIFAAFPTQRSSPATCTWSLQATTNSAGSAIRSSTRSF